MITKIVTILECSRIFSLPMTIFSWLVIFIYSAINSGNILFGLVAFLGLCFAHLGINLLDDFFDYKFLIKRLDFDKQEYLKCSQKTKCRYLISGFMTESRLLLLISLYFLIAFSVGFFLYVNCGKGVFYFALIGAIIGGMYPIMSRYCLSEIAVALVYGPALFGGVYYVMMGIYSLEVLVLSIPTMFFTIILLYVHTVMDFDFDLAEGKCTLANRFNSQLDSLVILKYLLILAYLSFLLLPIFDVIDWQVFIVYLTIPMAIDLYNSIKEFSVNYNHMPIKKWYHFPMEKLEYFNKRGEGAFMFRMLQSRNLMVYTSFMLILSILICSYF